LGKRFYARNKKIVEKTHDKKKEEVKPKIGEINVSTHTFRFTWF